MREGETPVPIPNTKVKTLAADDTRAATPRESRRLPDFFIKEKLPGLIAQPVRAHA